MLATLASTAPPLAAVHSLQWTIGWSLVLTGFVTGALLGLGFFHAAFLGGYDSFRRRIWRLGHVACVALGGLLVVVSTLPRVAGSEWTTVADHAFITGALAMPTVCLLAGWRAPLRHLFFIPVLALLTGVICTLLGGTP